MQIHGFHLVWLSKGLLWLFFKVKQMNQDLLCCVPVSWEISWSLLMYIREFSIGKIKFIVKYIFVMTLVGDGDSMVCTAYAHLEPAAISRIAHLEDELVLFFWLMRSRPRLHRYLKPISCRSRRSRRRWVSGSLRTPDLISCFFLRISGFYPAGYTLSAVCLMLLFLRSQGMLPW